MRRFFTFLTLMLFAFAVNAQYIYNDFDENQNEIFNGWPNQPTIIANPDVSGVDTSANVAEWVRSTEQWAHVYCQLPGKIDFSTGTVFNLKVHSPIACTVLFKLEDKNDGSISTELSSDVSDTNTWVQLSFDFTDGESNKYDQITIFFDFSSTTDNTFYFDDVTGPEYIPGGSGQQVDLPVTFEDPDVNYMLTDFGGTSSEIVADPTDETNTVAKTIKTDAAETWAGTTVGGAAGFANPIPFTETFTTMSVDVWSPAAGYPVRLKVEDANDPTISVETEDTSTVAMGWETLYFDFSNNAEGTAPLNLDNTYNKASIFFNFGTSGGDAGELTFYWDNMYFLDNTGIINNEFETLSIYPNPAVDVLHLRNAANLKNVTIYSVNGQMIYSAEKVGSSIDLSNFTSGFYTITAKGIDGTQYHAKFIVK